MKPVAAAFASGLLFALGLGVSGMTRPAKVLAFLDFSGSWDPSLAFVMVGAIATYTLAYRSTLRRPAPLFARSFDMPAKTEIDRRLVAGSALFGIGWGLAGYCPGPAVVQLGAGTSSALVFVPAMVAGMWLARLTVLRRRA